ncbi:MAG: Fe-S cluster assembly protein SufD [Acidobacteriota bacterium]
MRAPAAFSAVLEAAAAAPAPEPLRALRHAGRANLEELGLPSRRQEEWRFTRLDSIGKAVFEPPPAVPSRVDISTWKIPASHLLVFVDGILDTELSDVQELPDGVVVSNLVLAASAGSRLVNKHLGSLAPLGEHFSAALNTAVFSDGALVHLPAGVELEQPIQLLFVSGADSRTTLAAPRVLVVAGPSSRATVVESHVGGGGGALSCPVSEIVLDDEARVEHIVVVDEASTASHLAVRQVQLAERSNYVARTLSLGGALVRTDMGVTLDGEGAEAELDGLYVTDGDQQADSHITVRHAQPGCRSSQLYKGILAGSSRAVFTGRIIVDLDAQKTDARQSNRNLLLSDQATVNSNPQLEIFADDVRCTHGSTVGRLDEEAVFYLRSRGIGREEARRLLTLAFTNEVVGRIPIESLRSRLESEISRRLQGAEQAGDSA